MSSPRSSGGGDSSCQSAAPPPPSSSSSSTRLSLGTPFNFPVGPAASRKLRKLLVSSTDPSGTVISFQKANSLHSYLAKSFGTTPVHELKSTRHRQSTRGALEAKSREDDAGLRPEPFRPDPALNFLGRLGVARYDVHRRVADALRQALEDEIGRSRLSSPASHDALLNLLKSTWQYASIPELRPVLACLIKKLGDRTPSKVLELLAERSGGIAGEGEFKHSDLLARLGLPMRRLVYESDWEARAVRSGSGGKDAAAGSTLATDYSALADLVRPAVNEYRADAVLGKSSDVAFVGSVRERKVATQGRRTMGGAAAAAAAGVGTAGHGSAGGSLASIAAVSAGAAAKKDKTEGSGASNDGSKSLGDKASSGDAVVKIKEVVGDRPKLLGAVLSMLVTEHGASLPSSRETVLGGHLYLACPLVSDVLLSYGPLPRQYEHVGLLARVLDNAVKLGAITDDALAQVQGCLRFIYQADTNGKEKADGDTAVGDGGAEKKRKEGEPADGADDTELQKKKKTKKASSSGTAASQHDDTTFQLKLLRKVANAAISALRQSDPQGLFLNPVTDEIAPGYSSVISEPMCLRTMEDKAEITSYSTLSEFERDVQLMYNNCIAYNIGKDGQWFRGEARRQGKVWRDEVMPQARALFKKEMAKRKKALERAAKLKAEKAAVESSGGGGASSSDANTSSNDKKRKRDEHEEQKRAARVEKIQKALGAGSANDQAAVRKLTAADVDPLPPSQSKRRKKDAGLPSMPCLASMMLSDPFVVRLLLDRVVRSIRSDVLKGKSVPAGHKTIPSLMQLLHMVQFSTRLCAIRGKRFFVPDVGFAPRTESGWEEQQQGDDGDPGWDVPYASLRRYTPLLARLLLETDLDRRMVAGGDLFDATSVGAVPALPEPNPTRWEDEGWGGHVEKGPSAGAALRTAVPRALVECALVHLVQPGNSNEPALQRQFPRFAVALEALAGTDFTHERPFFVSFSRALLRHKSKLLHGTRDAVAESWIGWIRGRGKKKRRKKDVMSSAVHECFVYLMNEWASLGNILLPRDTMLKFAEDAVAAAENVAGEGAFARKWAEDSGDFAPVKAQYVKMLEGMPNSRANQWREKVGIDDDSLNVLAEKFDKKNEGKDPGTNVDL